jgi:hypothetical protein
VNEVNEEVEEDEVRDDLLEPEASFSGNPVRIETA